MTTDERPWYVVNPPEIPIKPSLFGLIIRREKNPMIRGEGGRFSGESAVPGQTLSPLQMDIIKAIAGGCPVDPADPGVQLG